MEHQVIHIFGASGSGTTTLGGAIASKWGFAHLDTDDYYWLPTDPPYSAKRAIPERIAMLRAAIANQGDCVLTGSLCGWGDELIPLFTSVVFVKTDSETRLARLRERELNKLGTRILPGGDMYEEHEAFLAWAARYDTAGMDQRSLARHEQWLKGLACPVVRVDGSAPVEESLLLIQSAMLR